MTQNTFEYYQQNKERLSNLIRQAVEYSWIKKERADELVKKLDEDKLTIAVIGQMKCGKSTFLNSFVFGDDVLPSATTPMTAALSSITYGKEKKLIAEFYTENEWNEQKMQAARNPEQCTDEFEKSKIEAAKTLVEASFKLGGELKKYLGKEKEDSLSNLKEYVGAEGKFVAITKNVRIFYPNENLKGVEIVDTPGMNDPIASREERTKEFLNKADVVLLMLYAGRPFDAKDRTILFEDVKKCGPGKILIGINKYDIPYENGDTEKTIREYVKEQIIKKCEEIKDSTMQEILQDVEPVLLSANMALLSQLPVSKIQNYENYNFDWKRYCEIFDISSQKQFREKSHIDDLFQKITEMIEKEKGKILFAKPRNEIIESGTARKAEIENNIDKLKVLIKVLEMPDDELEENKSNFERLKKRLTRLLENYEVEMEDLIAGFVKDSSNKIQSVFDNACRKIEARIDNWGFPYRTGKIQTELEREFIIANKSIDMCAQECKDDLKRKLRMKNSEVFEDAVRKCEKLDDINIKPLIRSCENKLNTASNKTRDVAIVNKESSLVAETLINGAVIFAFGPIGLAIKQFIQGQAIKDNLRKQLNEIIKNFDPKKCFEDDIREARIMSERFRNMFSNELIDPIIGQIDECLNNAAQREKKLEENKKELQTLEKQKTEIEMQIEKISQMIV